MKKLWTRWVMIGVLATLFVLSLGWFGYANYRASQEAGMAPADLAGSVLLSLLLLSIPLGLLYFSIGLIAEAVWQHRRGVVGPRMAKFLVRTPRAAGALVALFTGLFALDVFSEQAPFWQQLGAFFIHASPSIAMLVLLALAWRRAWIGALAFGLAALVFLRFVIGDPLFGLGNLLIFVLPMSVVAVLFWLSWRWRADLTPAAKG